MRPAWFETNLEALLEPQALAYCIRRCCELKADVVAADEREQGQRALLIISATSIATPSKPIWAMATEAVAAGMMMAVRTARRLGQFSDTDAERVRALLLCVDLPVSGPAEMAPGDYLPHYNARQIKSSTPSCVWCYRWC